MLLFVTELGLAAGLVLLLLFYAYWWARAMTERRFPPPWTVTETEGAFVVCDADGQSLAYLYWREPRAAAEIAKVLTWDEARRIAVNIAKLPDLLGATS